MTCYRSSQCAKIRPTKAGWQPGLAMHGPFCDVDHNKIRHALRVMPWVRLQMALAVGTKGQGGGGGGFTKSIYPAIPIRVEVDAMIKEMDTVIFDWASVVARETNMTPAWKFAPACSLILANIDYLYTADNYVIGRWVSERRVASLSPAVQGTVSASGDALISFEANGPYGAVELLNIYRRACGMLRIDP